METRAARPLAADGIHKLPRLVVAERDQRVAVLWIARRAGSFPELFRNGNRFQSRSARLAGLQFVPIACDKNVAAFAAIDFHVIETAPAFIAATRELVAF